MLFSGSMRKNLDPFDQHTDEELWDVLEEVNDTDRGLSPNTIFLNVHLSIFVCILAKLTFKKYAVNWKLVC